MRLKRYWWAVLAVEWYDEPLFEAAMRSVVGNSCVFGAVLYRLCQSAPGRIHSVAGVAAGAGPQIGLLYRAAPLGMGGYGLYERWPVRRLWALLAGNIAPRIPSLSHVATVFSIYAWSGRVTNVSRLRQGWLWFAVLALVAFALLYLNRNQ